MTMVSQCLLVGLLALTLLGAPAFAFAERTTAESKDEALARILDGIADSFWNLYEEAKKTHEKIPDNIAHWADEVQKLYEKVKEKGENVPGNIADWVKEEFRKQGTWEYKIVVANMMEDSESELLFKALGQDRWEVFWIERDGKKLRLFLKRPAKSYLETVPLDLPSFNNWLKNKRKS